MCLKDTSSQITLSSLPLLVTILSQMTHAKQQLIQAEQTALKLFTELVETGLIKPGITEKELNTSIFELARERFGIDKYWHKRIVRAGANTLLPYDENPQDLVLQEDDILFLDFGPILEDWEADLGRTYVIGNDAMKLKMMHDVEDAWHKCKAYFEKQPDITGAQYYEYVSAFAKAYNWEFGGPIAGHLIGHFPHEKLDTEDMTNYIHPDNHVAMRAPDANGNPRDWILEIHFVDRKLEIGGFFEQLLT